MSANTTRDDGNSNSNSPKGLGMVELDLFMVTSEQPVSTVLKSGVSM